MIEKLAKQNTWGECLEKLNEVIDAVNKHEDIIRQIGEWGSSKGECLWCENLTRVDLDDRFAEQRKWIGKLCKFWDDSDNPENCVYDVLCNIFDPHYEDCPFQCGNGEWYEYCEPVKPDNDIIYRGE